MKKRALILFPILLSVLLVSCATASSNTAVKLPLWFYNPQRIAGENETAFVGEGIATTERQALLIAYADINRKLCTYLGVPEKSETYRELSTKEEVKEYGLTVRDKYFTERTGIHTVAVLAVADKNLLQKSRTEDMVKESEIEEQAVSLIHEGDELIRNNYDIQGVKKYLESMILTYPLIQVEKEYSFPVILDEVLDIIKSSSISISKKNTENVSCSLSVKRKASLISSKVINCPIKASYLSKDILGRVFEDYFSFATEENGTVSFEPKNNEILQKGEVVFNFDLDEEIQALEKLSPSAAQILRTAIEEKTVRFPYEKEYRYGQLGICIFEQNLNDVFEMDSVLSEQLKERFQVSGIEAFVCNNFTESEDIEIIKKCRDIYPYSEFLVVCRIAPYDWVESKTGITAVTTYGNCRLYNLRQGTLVFDSNETYSNGFGKSAEEALNNSYTNFVSIIYSVLKANYV